MTWAVLRPCQGFPIPATADSRTYLLRNVPLQPLGGCQAQVGLPTAVAPLIVTQLEGICRQHELKGKYGKCRNTQSGMGGDSEPPPPHTHTSPWGQGLRAPYTYTHSTHHCTNLWGHSPPPHILHALSPFASAVSGHRAPLQQGLASAPAPALPSMPYPWPLTSGHGLSPGPNPYLPEVPDDGRVSPGMLSISTQLAVLVDD